MADPRYYLPRLGGIAFQNPASAVKDASYRTALRQSQIFSLLFNFRKGALTFPIISFHPSGISFLNFIHRLLPLQPICIMRTSFALFFAALVQQVSSSRHPLLQWDPDTVKDCVDWYNNGDGKTCEYVRGLYGSKYTLCTRSTLSELKSSFSIQSHQKSFTNGTLQSVLIACLGNGSLTASSRKEN
jgi:hypothetical protein